MRAKFALLIGVAVCTGAGLAQPLAPARTASSTPSATLPPTANAPTTANPPAIYSGRYLGCFADRRKRDLTGPNTVQAGPQACITYCAEQEFRFASMQNGNECFCGESYGRYGASNACVACAGRPDEACGGVWANAVWEVSGRLTRLPPPPTLLPPTRKALPTGSPPVK
jgi:hypothetical protein